MPMGTVLRFVADIGDKPMAKCSRRADTKIGSCSVPERNPGGVLARQRLAQHRGVAQVDLARGREQRGATAAHGRPQLGELVMHRLELGEIAAAKFGKALRLVPIPAAKLVRRRELLGPAVERELVLGDPARPQAVDQDAHPVARFRRIVDPLDADQGTRPRFWLCSLRSLAGCRRAHRLLRARTSISSATLRRCSALLPEAIACSTQVAAWSRNISSSTARSAARTAETCVTTSMQ